MLSDDLAAMAERLARYDADGVDLHPVAVHAIVAILRDCAARAAVLEGQPVPPPLRGVLPEGVASLEAARRRRAAA
jgi:hypothetical protein